MLLYNVRSWTCVDSVAVTGREGGAQLRSNSTYACCTCMRTMHAHKQHIAQPTHTALHGVLADHNLFMVDQTLNPTSFEPPLIHKPALNLVGFARTCIKFQTAMPPFLSPLSTWLSLEAGTARQHTRRLWSFKMAASTCHTYTHHMSFIEPLAGMRVAELY